ncbi:hypothetical protein SHKM778_75520 [Streptomyces sp. KM77-8]|uniref:Transposase n=1 Tax=Streptomyces haneummycinicus TaxID=3074435 RepID=A0AAT9HV56_9ACTN
MSRGREPVGGVLNGLDAGRVRAVLLMSGMPWDELDDGLQQVRLKVLEQQGRFATSRPGQRWSRRGPRSTGTASGRETAASMSGWPTDGRGVLPRTTPRSMWYSL